MQELSRRISYVKEDETGNKLFVTTYQHTESDKPAVAVVKLQLATERQYRNLGYITMDDGMFHVKRDRQKHLHNQSNSYGFNFEVIKDNHLFSVTQVHLQELTTGENGEVRMLDYIFPIHALLNYGSYLHFKEQGFELQRFLKLDIIKQFKVEDYDGLTITKNPII